MKIQILMSTYNGSEYIRTQLDSIIAQDIKDKSLLIRDDGSMDDTVKIIGEYQERYPWISYYKGVNIGVQRSFLELISRADETANYIALSDQDDEWLPEKLSRAVWCLEKLDGKKEIPLLYFSDKYIVDENLQPLHTTVSRPIRKITFGSALVQGVCTGCTIVMNQSLCRLIASHLPENGQNVIMHDWWIYLCASCFGKVYYDAVPYIRYRQHGRNTSGAMLNRTQLMKYRMVQFMQPRGEIFQQAALFRACFSDLLKRGNYKENLLLIQKLCTAQKNLGKRIAVAADMRFFRQKKTDDFIFRMIVVLGKL